MYGWRLKVRCAPAALRTDTRGRSPAAASHRTFSEGYGTGAAEAVLGYALLSRQIASGKR